jgi:hypothetical protein
MRNTKFVLASEKDESNAMGLEKKVCSVRNNNQGEMERVENPEFATINYPSIRPANANSCVSNKPD